MSNATEDDHSGSGYQPIPAFADWFVGHFDTSDFDRFAGLLAKTKEDTSAVALAQALQTAMRYAAIDTGAIEGLYPVDRGFTRTVATQAAAWEATLVERGATVRRSFLAALEGYERVLDAATKSITVSEVWIRELHQVICESQETYTVHTELGTQEVPLPKGVYKTMPNSPSLPGGRIHHYAPPEDTAPEMHRLVMELRSEAFLAAHPVLQAAYAHYGYVCIHPFADGNGRVARALASIYLYRNPGVPLVIFADQRNDYFDALEAADAGRPSDFISFLGTRVVDAIGIMRVTMRKADMPTAESIAALGAIYSTNENFDELQAAAVRLKVLATAELTKQLGALELPPQLHINGSGSRIGDVPTTRGYASIGSEGHLYFRIHGDWPARVDFMNSMAVLVRVDETADGDLILRSERDDILEVMAREVAPTASELLKLKLSTWIESQLAFGLANIAQQAREARS